MKVGLAVVVFAATSLSSSITQAQQTQDPLRTIPGYKAASKSVGVINTSVIANLAPLTTMTNEKRESIYELEKGLREDLRPDYDHFMAEVIETCPECSAIASSLRARLGRLDFKIDRSFLTEIEKAKGRALRPDETAAIMRHYKECVESADGTMQKFSTRVSLIVDSPASSVAKALSNARIDP